MNRHRALVLVMEKSRGGEKTESGEFSSMKNAQQSGIRGFLCSLADKRLNTITLPLTHLATAFSLSCSLSHTQREPVELNGTRTRKGHTLAVIE